MPLVSGLGAVMNVAANFLLIPLFGMLGAAYATLLAYLSMAIYQYYLSQKFYEIQYEWKKIFEIGLIMILIFGGYLILKPRLFEYILFLKIFTVLIYIILLKFFGLIDFRWFREFKF